VSRRGLGDHSRIYQDDVNDALALEASFEAAVEVHAVSSPDLIKISLTFRRE
jgi:hypothetical protein